MRPRFTRSIRYWMIPLVYMGATVCLGLTLPRIEYRLLPGLSHEITTSSAIAIFSSIASGMIALTAIVFSLAFVMVQLGASAYSPRLVSWFSENPLIFHSLGVFSATFLYALATLGWVDRGAAGRVPFISTWVVILLLVSSMIALVRLVCGLSELQIARVLRYIGHAGRVAIEEMYPVERRAGLTDELKEDLLVGIEKTPAVQTLRFSGEPLTVVSIDVHCLVRLAREAQGLIVLGHAVGDPVREGAPIVQILGAKKEISESELVKTIKLRPERAFDQDPGYAIRLLVDIGIKALSPAINDPTTAVQAIDRIEDLLARLSVCTLDNGCVEDESGTLRLVFPTPRWDDYLSLAFDEISFYGASSVQVMRKLRSALSDLVEMAQPEKKEAIRSYMEYLNTIIAHSFSEEQDRRKARREDRQGLGHTWRRY